MYHHVSSKKITMSIRYSLIILLLALCCFSQESYAQKAKLKVAQTYYDQFDFKTAIEIYRDILSNPKFENDTTTLRLAADCEFKLAQFAQAEALLTRLNALPTANTEDMHRLADVYKIQGKYLEAVDTYRKILLKNPKDEIALEYSETPDFANKLRKDSTMYELKNSEINSASCDFAPGFFVNGKLIFSSSRGLGVGARRNYNWNEQPYLNNYLASIGSDSSLSNVVVMGSDINSRYHEGTVTYSPSDNLLYFTRNNLLNGNVKKSKDGRLYLGIYYGETSSGGNVSDLKPFPFNNKEYTLQHPTLTSSGKKMFFSSNKPGGFGGMDLYFSIKENDAWQEPKNMGEKINSPGDDVFPFIINDSTLYFSSNGRLGLGGLDIFYVQLNGDTVVQNLGYPANSAYDDFGLVFFPNEITGYLVSNRPGGKGDDDIYEFRISPPDFINIKGRVVDAATLIPLKNALVTITNQDGSVVQALTDDQGIYTLTAPYKSFVKIEGEKKDYENGNVELATNPRSTDYTASDIVLKKVSFLATGKVVYDVDGSPAPGAIVRLRDKTGMQLDSCYVKEDGSYKLALEDNKEYILEAYKKDYVLLTKDVSSKSNGQRFVNTDFRLFKLEKGTVVRLDNIYYDYGKSDIRSDAAQELNKLVRILQDNPTMKIELSSHTDARGGDAYNLKLSDARAASAVKYINSQGIDASRLVAKGYGETKLLNRCANNVQCSDEEHQFNRRTEFKILDI